MSRSRRPPAAYGPQAPPVPPSPLDQPVQPVPPAPLARPPAPPRSRGEARSLAGFLDLDYSDPGPWAPDRPPPPPAPPSFLPPPDQAAGAPASAGAGRTRRRRLTGLQRRIAELAALALLVPLTLGLEWYDESNQISKGLEPEETVTVVRPEKPATLAHARWVLLGRVQATEDSGSEPLNGGAKPQGAAKITLSLGMKSLDSRAAKEAATANLRFRLVDRAGNEWSARAEYNFEDSYGQAPPVGKAVPVVVTGEVPKSAVNSVVLDVIQAGPHRPKGPLQVLRFAHQKG
jgi:hypothetical protein